MNDDLLLRLKDARYKILVACRPLAPARYAFNATLQAIIDNLNHCPTGTGDDDMVKALTGLMLQD